jgi:hypothetical protein
MPDTSNMSEDEALSEWVKSLEDELEETAGTNDYLEVVERAEESSKKAESLANIAGKVDHRSTLRSSS